MLRIQDKVRVNNVISNYFNCQGVVKEIRTFSLRNGLKERFYVLFSDGDKISFWPEELEKI
jgi:hypothetical protein